MGLAVRLGMLGVWLVITRYFQGTSLRMADACFALDSGMGELYFAVTISNKIIVGVRWQDGGVITKAG